MSSWHRQIELAIQCLRRTFAAGGRVYTAGNGGSATLAQHFSDEMVGRYKRERRPYPVIALTAHSITKTRDAAIDAGCDEYETKPLDFERLVSKIEKLLA